MSASPTHSANRSANASATRPDTASASGALRWPWWTTARVLDLASAACAFIAIGFLVVPTRTTTARQPSAGLPRVAPLEVPSAAMSDSAAARIVSENVFSSSRRAPASRFMPPGSEPSPSFVEPTSAPTSITDADNVDGARLFGIIMQDGRVRALLRLPGADSATRLMAAGESRAGYRVQRIETDRIVITSSEGSRTLLLVPRTASDSLGNRP